MIPDINRLAAFYQVFRSGSIALAAGELFVTQSAVSQSLKKLEEELRLSLFTRLHRKLLPTPAGEQLFQVVMPFFSTLERDLDAIHSADRKPFGLIRIGAPAVFGAEYLPRLIATFRETYPDVRFQLELGQQSTVAAAFRNGALDVALVDIFGNREEASWNLIQEPLLDEPLVMVASAPYFESHLKGSPGPDGLAGCRYVAYQPQAPELSDWFGHHFGGVVIRPEIVLIVQNVRAVISAVRNHIGLGIVPLYLVRPFLEQRELVHIRGRNEEVVSRISLLRHPGRKPGVTERTFMEHLKNAFHKTGTPPEIETEPAKRRFRKMK